MAEKKLRKLEQDIKDNANKISYILNVLTDIRKLVKLKQCYKCRGYFNENNLTKIELEDARYMIPQKIERLYCRNCKPDYSKIVITNEGETKYKLAKFKN